MSFNIQSSKYNLTNKMENNMLGVGEELPQFNVKATTGKKLSEINIDNVFIEVNNNTYPGKWLVLFFYPKDFTFVCPTEIAAFGELAEEFSDRDAQILGVSTDSEFVHWSWRKHQEDLMITFSTSF